MHNNRPLPARLGAFLACLLLGACASPPASSSGRKDSPLPKETLRKLAEAEKRNTAPSFTFPWTDLAPHLATQPDARLLLVGYGSLMNLESASETIRGLNAKNSYPVVAAGAKRVFNYRIPPGVLKELGGNPKPNEIAALNVVATGRGKDVLNGRILPIALADLPAMREREYGYHLRPVTCLRWDDLEGEPFTAYVLCAEDAVVQGRQILDPAIKPNPEYVKICAAGARSVSPRFEELFLETSFLADGTTSLRQWLASGRANAPGATRSHP